MGIILLPHASVECGDLIYRKLAVCPLCLFIISASETLLGSHQVFGVVQLRRRLASGWCLLSFYGVYLIKP